MPGIDASALGAKPTEAVATGAVRGAALVVSDADGVLHHGMTGDVAVVLPSRRTRPSASRR